MRIRFHAPTAEERSQLRALKDLVERLMPFAHLGDVRHILVRLNCAKAGLIDLAVRRGRRQGIAYAALIGMSGVAGCTHERWEPVVYPNRSNLTDYRRLAERESLEECRAAAKKKLAELGAAEAGDYECGLNCQSGQSNDLKVCDQTSR